MAQKETAALVKEQAKETVDKVLAKVMQFEANRQLHLPVKYSAANALKAAWLIIQQTVAKDKRPALNVCTQISVANALLDTVVQGLNPAKKQCYYLVYGNKLLLQRSYFGDKAIALRVDDRLDDIYAEVVWEGDELEYEIKNGLRIITKHVQKIENVGGNIIAAYAVAVNKEGNVQRSELMTFEQIKRAWRQSKVNPIDDNGNVKPGTTHDKFGDEMAKRTVTRRMAKHIINTSSDSDLLIESVNRTDELQIAYEAEVEADEHENTQELDFEETDQPLIEADPVSAEPGDTEPADEDDDSWMHDTDPANNMPEPTSKAPF
jgi:recombination protein RecT